MEIHFTENSPEVQIISATSVNIIFSKKPISFYRHGWQSWTLAAWTDPDKELPMMKPDRFHVRQADPVYARHPYPNGSWVGAFEFNDGKIVLLGALGLDAHVESRNGQLNGWYEENSGDWMVAQGYEEAVFTRYTSELAGRLGRTREIEPPRVWCSWYSLYKEIDEEKILYIVNGLGNLPFDVIQIDDGWQAATGDWFPNSKFPSGMDGLAKNILKSGRKAGLWMAPFAVSERSSLYKEHPDWLLKSSAGDPVSAGYEWGGNTFALDVTHPGAAEWLKDTISRVRRWGYEYLKMDFLYAGALPGRRFKEMPREAAYRLGLNILRQAAGDAYILTCGAPILPSIGLCDAIRIGPDVAAAWDSRLYSYLLYNQTTPGVKNALRTSVNRLWLQPLIHVDPDVASFQNKASLTGEQRQLFEDLTDICKFKATSDLPGAWTKSEHERVKNWLNRKSNVKRTGRYKYLLGARIVDFSSAVNLPPKPGGVDSILRWILAYFGNQLWILKLWDFLFRTKPQTIK